jgi:transcriptional regulator with XRE-family HTH domain
MSDLAKLFGERVKALRAERGFSQVELADRAQLSEEWIRRIERGEASPSFQTIEVIAGALSVAYAELFTANPPTTPAARLDAALEGLDDDAVRWLINGARLLRKS